MQSSPPEGGGEGEDAFGVHPAGMHIIKTFRTVLCSSHTASVHSFHGERIARIARASLAPTPGSPHLQSGGPATLSFRTDP